jgi:hypothetical protein
MWSEAHVGSHSCCLDHVSASAGLISEILSFSNIHNGITRNQIIYFKLSLELFLIVGTDPPKWFMRGAHSPNPIKG